jgi:hypothetical protein
MTNPFRYFNSSPEVIRLVVMMYVRYPLSLRNVEDLLAERGIDISHETVRFWWNRFGPVFAAEIRKRRVAHMRGYPQWRWHLDEAFVKVNGRLCYLWRAVDHEGEVLEAVVTAKRDKSGGAEVSQADPEEVRPTAEDRHRQASGLFRGDERNGRRRSGRRIRICGGAEGIRTSDLCGAAPLPDGAAAFGLQGLIAQALRRTGAASEKAMFPTNLAIGPS